MNIENEQNKENLKITPEMELQYTMEGVNEKNWGEVIDCLNQFTVKLPEAGLSSEEREKLKPKLAEIKERLSSEDVPGNYKSQIDTMLQRAEDAL